MSLKTEEETKERIDFSLKGKCKDFDKDCEDVENKVGCAMGGFSLCANGQIGFTEPIKGFCPYLNHNN